jgi:predicted RNA methylase
VSRALPASVLGVLERVEIESNRLRIADALDRALYLQVNKVLVALGGAWDRKAQAHIFTADPREAIDQVLADGTFTDARKEYDFFRTPHRLAESLVTAARIETGHRVLEPSAGDGRIARAIRVAHPGAELVVAELNEACRRELAADGFEIVAADFLSIDAEGWRPFDRIVMNPPFSRRQDVEHIAFAWRLLAPGGRLVAIAAAGITFREDRKTTELRSLIAEHGRCEALPDGSFLESGTAVRTVRVILDKPRVS